MAYSGVYVFGDSLVDVGNALALAKWYDGLPLTDLPDGAPTTEDGYFKGRFSNGYTFVDLISNKSIGVVTKPIFPFHYEDPWIGLPIAPFASDPNGNNLNFAYGGSHIRQGDEVVPDLDGQTDSFRDAVDGDAPSNALYLITTGGNDVRDLAPTGSDPVSQSEAYEELQRCADELLQELSQLIDDGARNFCITGIADVGIIPHYDRDGDGVLNATEQMRSDAATDYSIYLDTLIRTEVVPALEAEGATVTFVPLMDYVDSDGNVVIGALSANLPTIAALHGLTTEELTSNLRQYNDLIFFDHVHPNAQAHALLGAYMQSMINGTPWVETLPLTSTEVDYSTTATITLRGEVDQLVISMVAGTNYTFDMLGVSSLGLTGSLADPALRLLGPTGSLVASDDDSGAGFDATITFNPAAGGNYTLQAFAIGSVTGTYALQAAVVSGAAAQAGNTYVVNSASTLVVEGAGGVGQDVVKASVSYALSAGSEVEVLQTNGGKAAINLTGNEFGQALIGNTGTNILEGKGGADTLTGGAGKDVFVLGNHALISPGPSSIDRITDYARGEIVDITQVLSVTGSTNVVTSGFLRVTTGGLIQVDVNGGGNEWVTLSTINGNAAVTFRYLSGGTATTVAVSRIAESQQLANSNSNMALAGAIAAAGLVEMVPSSQTFPDANGSAAETLTSAAPGSTIARLAEVENGPLNLIDPVIVKSIGLGATEVATPRSSGEASASEIVFDNRPALTSTDAEQAIYTNGDGEAAIALAVAPSVAIPAAELIVQALEDSASEAKGFNDLPRIVAEILDGPDGHSTVIDAILAAVTDHFPLAELRPVASEPAGWDQLAVAIMDAKAGFAALPALHPDAVSS